VRQWLKGFRILRVCVRHARKMQVQGIYLLMRLGLPPGFPFRAAECHGRPQPVIVSVTSYPPRFRWLALTLRCLLNQSVKADRVILWVAHADRDLLPMAVVKLQARGLSIKSTEDLKSYKKLIPALQCYGFDVNHVIADDDMYYPRHWLATLLDDKAESAVVCHFARVWREEKGGIDTYLQWPELPPGAASSHGLLIGLGGVWFPPGSLGEAVCDYALASRLCPSQDDIWFTWHALMNGYQIKRSAVSVPRFSWPGADVVALSKTNNAPGQGNDQAIGRMVRHYGLPVLSAHTS
jgi:hypothetical protein